MNHVSSLGFNAGQTWSKVGRVNQPQPARAQRGADSVEFSPAARRTDGVRTNLVARIKAQIAAGTYDTENKVDAILDKIAQDLVK